MFVNFLITKNIEYLTEENSCFVILTNYLNEHICRHLKFPSERPFPSLKEELIQTRALIKFFSCEEGRSLNFSAVKRGAHSKEGVHLVWGALSDNYSMSPFVLLRKILISWCGKFMEKSESPTPEN